MLDKLPKVIQSEVYQFLTGPELIRLERLSKKVSAAAKQDFLWRYLSNNTLDIERAKLFGDNWKRHFWKQFGAEQHMTPERFRYLMCPVRHFKETV